LTCSKQLVRVLPRFAESAILNAGQLAGNVAIIERGQVSFVDKVRRAMDAGAVGVVIVNNIPAQPNMVIRMDDSAGNAPTGGFPIPAIMVGYSVGSNISSRHDRSGSLCSFSCSHGEEVSLTLSDDGCW
jgi:hypothetical protein